MKLSKKLLTALLPITAAATLAPVLVSCGSSYDITFGSNINCLNDKESEYHSLDDVKKAVKTHADRSQEESITITDLKKYSEATNEEKNKYYFDLIASHSLLNETKFKLVWADTVTLSLDGKGDKTGAMTDIQYVAVDNVIYLQLGDYQVKSYRFQNTEPTE